jgi:hypothetical protein
MHHWMPFQQLSSRPHAKDKHGGQQALLCRKFMVACEVREHGHDSKQRHQVEGPIMQAKEWMRVWAVQLVEHAGTKVTKGRSSRWRKDAPGEARSHPGRSAQAGRPPLYKHPPVLVSCRQAALPFLYLCARSFQSKTTIDLIILPKFVCSNNSHP